MSEGKATGDATLMSVLDEFESEGFGGQFEVTDAPCVVCISCGEESAPAELRVHARRRLEGVSDPDDMLAVFGVICPSCGTAGTLVLGFGPSSSDTDLTVSRMLGRRGTTGDASPAPGSGAASGR